MHRFHFWRTKRGDRSSDGKKGEKKGRTRGGMETKFRVKVRGVRRGRGGQGKIAAWAWGNTVRHGYAIARMRLVQPSGWQCALLFSFRFFLPLALAIFLSLFRPISFLSLQRSSQLSVQCQSVNFSFCSRFPNFSPFVVFRPRISDYPLNNCLLGRD